MQKGPSGPFSLEKISLPWHCWHLHEFVHRQAIVKVKSKILRSESINIQGTPDGWPQ
jgi:hypothetical protein